MSFNYQDFLASCSNYPGVYLMFGKDNKHLYIGKANNLHARLNSYFVKTNLAIKTIKLVSKINHIETIITRNETESLLLEQSLIKQHLPPYNILLRDDKSYPYVMISDDKFARISFYRGSKKASGSYFGPYPSAFAVKETLSLLQKAFLIRPCKNSQFNNRSRACLQYQIKRCSAPCVGLIDENTYKQDIKHAVMFLTGKNQELTNELTKKMEQAADNLDFERAIKLRNQIALIRKIQDHQTVTDASTNFDIIAIAGELDIACVHVISVRNGVMLGGRNYFPKFKYEQNLADVLYGFIAQYYLAGKPNNLPKELIVNYAHDEFELLAKAFKQQYKQAISIYHNVRSFRLKWQQLAITNANVALNSKIDSKKILQAKFADLTSILQLPNIPKRIECFDISHSSGEATIASCVVFGQEGAVKSDYRRYNITNITAGDDFAAMRKALIKRFSKQAKLPDLLLIDGGIGQLNIAQEVLAGLAIKLPMLAIAKGVTRKAGFETLYLNDADNIIDLPENSKALHLMQQIRDEAHRFAITGHRAKRDKTRITSQLIQVEGIGSTRRRELLKYFGGIAQLKRASCEELSKVKGISKKLAQNIYLTLHN